MGRLIRTFALAALVTTLSVGLAQAQKEEVTKQMIEEGASLYKGQGLCAACHGSTAKGIPNLGADLTDDEWLHSDGSLDGIVKSILAGVSPDKSSTGSVMPPKGGSALSEKQIRAVGAYVWSLSHKEK
jgi:mono/diheme cytochrome c family protein